MELLQLQTQPVCPKCKKGHSMRVSHVNVHTQEIFYQTECRIRPLKYSAQEMITQNPDDECFYLNNLGWVTYCQSNEKFAFQLSALPEENTYALMQAYENECKSNGRSR